MNDSAEGRRADPCFSQEEMRGSNPGKGSDLFPGNLLALETPPGEGAEDAFEMVAVKEFAGEFEVIEDAKGGDYDFHLFEGC